MQGKFGFSTRELTVAFLSAAGLVVMPIASAHAQTFSVVHNFNGQNDGGDPDDGLSMGSTGILYGTASTGGAFNGGVVFKVSAKGAEAVLHSFGGGLDGAAPNGGVIEGSAGVLYGTTTAGGASGSGTVFSVKGKKESVLYSFAGGADGAVPQAGLVADAAGNLYGTTSQGGTSGNGTVFELIAPTKKKGVWQEKILYSFGINGDGATPLSGVTLDASGNIYGTTSLGGAYGYGVVFMLKPGSTWTESLLHSFQNATDGSYPYAGLISDAAGNLYGATTQGGTNEGGTVFELTPSGGGFTFSVLTSVAGWGISGPFRNLMLSESGTIYGTTHCDGDNNAGTIFKLTPSGNSWTYTLLYTFTGGADGLFSISNLVMKQGKLFGTTINGGASGAGVIYQLKL